MRSRGLVVAIAVVLAVLAAVGVIVYTSSVRENAISENTTQRRRRRAQDIQANTPLDPLIAQGVFKLTRSRTTASCRTRSPMSRNSRVRSTTAPIYQNEQIPLDRISSGPGSNNLGSPGNVGLGLEVEGQAAVNGYVQQGSHVALYATFHQGTLVTRSRA